MKTKPIYEVRVPISTTIEDVKKMAERLESKMPDYRIVIFHGDFDLLTTRVLNGNFWQMLFKR